MTRRPRVALQNLGCRVNRVELDSIARDFERAGCELVAGERADLVVVNTCAVTGEAEAKARKAVRHAANLPARPIVVATGCVASLFSDELAALGEHVAVERDKRRVAERALGLLAKRGLAGVEAATSSETVACGHASQASGDSSPEAFAHAVTPTGRMRPGLKVQDGCDHRCTYCIVWKARGPARSTSPDEVSRGLRALVADGAREVVLTGIDLGRYEAAGLDLAGLLERLLKETQGVRLRLSSVEPAGVTDRLLQVMAASEGRVAPFLHVPLQSGCDDTLRRMARPYTVEAYEAVAERARAALPGLALACDLIVGFPGETEAEFEESLESCRRIGFAKMHVFRYSKRPGTPAAVMGQQVSPEASAERSRLMRELAAASRRAYAESLVGTRQLVLVEREAMGVTGGLVDALVDEGLRGRLVTVVPHALTSSGFLDARTREAGAPSSEAPR